MKATKPRWKRRKDARPAEIIAAAQAVFAENGFAAAKLDDIARRAGVAKSSLYLYFETKEDLFRAVVRAMIAPDLEAIAAAAEASKGPFEYVAPIILVGIATAMEEGRLLAMIKIVVGESRNFPDLARIWHDELLSKAVMALAALVVRAQARGELKSGDPQLLVFSLLGPMLMAALYRSVFAGLTSQLPDLKVLAAQHASTILAGMLIKPD